MKKLERDQHTFFQCHGLSAVGVIVCGVCGTVLRLEEGRLYCPHHGVRLRHLKPKDDTTQGLGG